MTDVAGDDFALLDAWRTGDRRAGDALVQRHFETLRRFFRSKLGDDIEDIIQATLLDCLERRAEIRDGGFRAYLFAVARNRLCDVLRTRYRPGGVLDPLTHSVADLRTSPSQHVARREEHRRMLEAMRGIAVDHQIALELAYWEGLSGKEIAIALEIDENTVRSRLFRAREALREALARQG